MIKHRFLRNIGVALVIVCCWVAGMGWYYLYTPAVTSEQGFRYVLQPAASVNRLISDLSSEKIIKHPTYFKILIYVRGSSHRLKAGEYLFPKGTTPSQIISQMVAGKGLIYHSFTIIAGWNFHQVSQALQQENNLRHLTTNLSDSELMKQLGSNYTSPEGLFFPDTYYFIENSTDLMLLKRAYHLMETKLNDAWQLRDSQSPFTSPYESLIAASLVEKEAYLNTERPIIAGVLMNRLKKDMLLQIDPTVIYGVGSQYNGKIQKKDLTANTPYNTYVHKGLPPTPIAMPSIDSIMAVMHPEQHDYIYFVAKGDGSHQFSKTLNEHNVAVTQLRLIEAKRPNTPYFNNAVIAKYLLIHLTSSLRGREALGRGNPEKTVAVSKTFHLR